MDLPIRLELISLLKYLDLPIWPSFIYHYCESLLEFLLSWNLVLNGHLQTNFYSTKDPSVKAKDEEKEQINDDAMKNSEMLLGLG